MQLRTRLPHLALLGATCVVALGFAQTPQEVGGRPDTQQKQAATNAPDDDLAESLREMREARDRFQQRVLTSMQKLASANNVRVDRGAFSIAFIGDGMIAGAAASGQGDASSRATQPEDREDQEATTGERPGQRGAQDPADPTQRGERGAATAGQDVQGIVIVSSSLIRSDSVGATQRPERGQEDSPQGARDNPTQQGRSAGSASGSEREAKAYTVVWRKGTSRIQLMDADGSVATTVALLGKQAGAQTTEASTRRAGSEQGDDQSDQAGGTKPQAAKRQPLGADDGKQQASMSAASDWNLIYASIVCGLMTEQ